MTTLTPSAKSFTGGPMPQSQSVASQPKLRGISGIPTIPTPQKKERYHTHIN